jgi:hypothetical protein
MQENGKVQALLKHFIIAFQIATYVISNRKLQVPVVVL